jgi:hypothetical protein
MSFSFANWTASTLNFCALTFVSYALSPYANGRTPIPPSLTLPFVLLRHCLSCGQPLKARDQEFTGGDPVPQLRSLILSADLDPAWDVT